MRRVLSGGGTPATPEGPLGVPPPATRRLISLSFLLSLLFVPVAHGWNRSDHQLMTRLALEEVSHEWGLDRPVEVRPLQSFLEKLAKKNPNLGDSWHFAEAIRINPKINLDRTYPPLIGKQTVTPLEILSIYSIDPDDGRDQDLFVRDKKGNPHYLYPDQKWFGSMTGGNSQAFRHIEKPPFDWRHPICTLGFPPWKIGEASERAQLYFDLSQEAFSLGEDYWGWRFLGNSLHYLEDLHQPYHAGQITPGLAATGLKDWFTSWGWKKGFMGTMAHLVSNSHRFFESYIAGGSATPSFKEAALRGTDHPPLPESSEPVEALAVEVRDSSNRFFPDLVAAITTATDPILRGSYAFRSDDPPVDDPEKFLKKGPDFEKANERIFEITRDRFASAGRAIRTTVFSSLPHRKGAGGT